MAHPNTIAEQAQDLTLAPEDLEEIRRRALLVKDSLLGAIAQSNQVSFPQLLNRFFMGHQMPVVFVLYQKDRTGNYRRALHTVQDPVYRDALEHQLKENWEKSGVLKRPEDAVSFYQYKLLALHIDKAIAIDEKRMLNASMAVSRRPASEDYCQAFIASLIGLLQKDVYRKEHKKHIARILHEPQFHAYAQKWNRPLDDKPLLDPKGNVIAAYGIKWNSELVQLETEQLRRIANIMDEAYRDCCASHLIKCDGRPANVLFCIKTYTRTSCRFYEKYAYDIRIIIPPTQHNDMLSLFRCMRDTRCSLGKGEWEYAYADAEGAIVTEVRRTYSSAALVDPKPADRAIDREFWELLRSDEGIATIMKSLALPSDDTRFICDPTVYSRQCIVKYQPFGRGGVERMGARAAKMSIWENKAQQRVHHDMLRMVATHYLLTAMAPPMDEKEELAVRCMPISVSGNAWMAMLTTDVWNTKRKMADDRSFYNGFRIYHNVLTPVTSTIRRRAKNLYLAQVRRMFHEEIRSAYLTVDGEFRGVDIAPLVLRFNRRSKQLCAIFPFDLVQLAYASTAEHKGCEKCIQLFNISPERVHVSTRENPLFRLTQFQVYITEMDIKEALELGYRDTFEELALESTKKP